MQRRGHRVGHFEVRLFEEDAAEGRHEEHDDAEQRQEHTNTHHVLDRVVRVERDAVDRLAVGALVRLDLDAVGVVGARLAQGHQVQGHQQQQHQRHRHDMQREEAVQGRIGDAVVTADPLDQARSDDRHGAEEVHDDLRPPERHVAPGQHVAHEGLGHQREINDHAEQPQQFARGLVRAVQHRAEHVQVDDDEEGRGARGVQVAQEPAVGHLAHDVLDRVEGRQLAHLVVHGEEDAGDQLHHQDEQGQRAEEVPDVEVLRRVVAGQLIAHESVDRQALVEPAKEAGADRQAVVVVASHHAAPCAVSSRPMTSVLSLLNE